MGRKSRWTESVIQDGVGEVQLLSWRYYYDFVHQRMLDYETYIWRGHRCVNWLLESTLDRLVKQAKVAKKTRWTFRQSHLEQFKFAARGRIGSNPPTLESENDWWALGNITALLLRYWTGPHLHSLQPTFLSSVLARSKRNTGRSSLCTGQALKVKSRNCLLRKEKRESKPRKM